MVFLKAKLGGSETHVLYVTAQVPWGRGESFILPEVMEVERQGHRVTICPLRPQKRLAPGSEAAHVARYSIRLPLFGLNTLFCACRAFLWRPAESIRAILQLLRKTTGTRRRLKNSVIVPKGLALAWIVHRLRPDHIHAHWASTPSSAAFIAAEISGISWSFTAHRWDIKERNALSLKITSAAFARAISEKGAALLRNEVTEDKQSKVLCIHMGCCLDHFSRVPSDDTEVLGKEQVSPPLIVCPANLLPVKGHETLIKACSILRDQDIQFRCVMFGQGPLEQQLKLMTSQYGLGDVVEWPGLVPHDELIRLYKTHKVALVALPSIVTQDGEEEGIPVSLIEAMAAGIPVVSTVTGSIPELLHDGAGLLVQPGDPASLAVEIRRLLEDQELCRQVAKAGQTRVQGHFDIRRTVTDLLSAMCRW